jgi:RimJ/RimL family protein N-acetyltransferase
MSSHRGHRLGTAMKLATLEVIRRDHPERTAMHTWTAVDNAPMQRVNRAFGYRPVERMHEMQRGLADA